MNGTEVRAAFETVLAAWNARDLDTFCAQLAPDIHWHDLGMPHPPAVGHDAVRRFSRRERASVGLQKSHAWWLRRREASKPPAA